MQYLVAIHHPDDYDPAIAEDEEMERDIDVLNEEMIAAGVRVFAGGLHPARSAKSLRAKPDGRVPITDGPYLETTQPSWRNTAEMHEVASEMEEKKSSLGVAIARGQSVAAWARKNGVAERTAQRWAREPEVRKEVANCRRRLMSRALGRMTPNTARAAEIIVRIAVESDSEAVRLKAARAVFSDLIAGSKFSDLEERILEVEEMIEMIEQRIGAASDSSAGGTRSSTCVVPSS